MAEYVTRKAGCEMVERETGIPLKPSAVEKAAIKGEGPPPAARYGNQYLYRPDQFLAWAKARLKIIESAEAA